MTELKIEKVTEDSPLKAKVQRIYMCARHERTLQGESPVVRAVAPST